ncbi:hypothetical protein EVAR_5382_1 [Eumeta japonica]|uniref:Uncharacterized protein n=1 Tax=Eumeta variegata TaxID=151549 RepID=A0A4C1TP01_EUMVA|nr:hypothetical protein EVAR_5382_1 [Eumeta japonica]
MFYNGRNRGVEGLAATFVQLPRTDPPGLRLGHVKALGSECRRTTERPIRRVELRPIKSQRLGSQNLSSIGNGTIGTVVLFSKHDFELDRNGRRYLPPLYNYLQRSAVLPSRHAMPAVTIASHSSMRSQELLAQLEKSGGKVA